MPIIISAAVSTFIAVQEDKKKTLLYLFCLYLARDFFLYAIVYQCLSVYHCIYLYLSVSVCLSVTIYLSIINRCVVSFVDVILLFSIYSLFSHLVRQSIYVKIFHVSSVT